MQQLKNKKSYLTNISLLIASAVIMLLLAELVSTLFFKVELPHMVDSDGNYQKLFVPDSILGKAPKANFEGTLVAAEFRTAIRTNELGFRSDFEYETVEGNGPRIMFIGDSFTFGFGVERHETFDMQLQKMFSDSLKIDIEPYNLGVIGFGTIQEMLLFKRYKKLNPDLVVLGFYARDIFGSGGGNDLVENYYFAKSKAAGFRADRKGVAKKVSPVRRFRAFLKDNSNLYRTLELAGGGFIRKHYLPNDNPVLRDEAWRITEEALREFSDTLVAIEKKAVLLWIPYPQAIETKNLSITERFKNMSLKNVIIADPIMEMAGDPMHYYYKLNSHWNANGHRMAAEVLFKKVMENDLLELNQRGRSLASK